MIKFNWGMRACGVLLLWTATAVVLRPQGTAVAPRVTFTTLHSFDGTDGTNPRAGLVQTTDGNLYGTTYEGGTPSAPCGQRFGCGTVFKITPSGKLTTLHTFDGTGGTFPEAELFQATNGTFYGTTSAGGASGYGAVFKITPSGKLATMHSFERTDGRNPLAGLVQGPDGNLYGTTFGGGANTSCFQGGQRLGCGTVFKITPSGKLMTLHSFDKTDGDFPAAGLVQGPDGNFYGTTYGGANTSCFQGCGTVFKITSSGTLTTLHRFDGADGIYPWAGLVQATNGHFYGITEEGGAYGYGTVFKITPSGTLTTLHSFTYTEGPTTVAGLVQATDGNFYGTTVYGGADNDGTVFKITPSGKLTTLHSFDITDGANTVARLVQDTDGNFYGTTSSGGADTSCYLGCGTVFSLSVGLGPFVKTQPTSGETGVAVNILGTNLTGSTSVTFNGTAATFTVVSPSEITTTVPTGAITGTVQVVTPGGTLSSNVPFRVK
jgi:uncharacterized repeat protein (TIGR03803 family)